jgi:alkylhydroperoxidase/carboxymuconolactone decarboxylase family protein
VGDDGEEYVSMASHYQVEDLARFGDMGKVDPKNFENFMKWYGGTLADGAIDAKTKKLIALAVSFAVQCPYCIDAYSKGCAEAGFTPEQMAEAVGIAASIKGGAVIAHFVQATNTLEREG